MSGCSRAGLIVFTVSQFLLRKALLLLSAVTILYKKGKGTFGMQFKCKLAAVCAAISLVSVAAQAEVLRIGSETVYPPFEYLNSTTKQYEGFDMDLIQALGKKAGFEPKIVSMGLDGLIPALVSGSIDASISALTVTEERAKKVDFTKGYYNSGLAIVVRAENVAKVKSVKDLENKTLCAEIGSDGALFSSKIPGVTVRTFNAVAEAFMEINQKGCYGIINDKPVNDYFLNSKAGKSMSLKEAPFTLTSDIYGIAVKKGNKELLQRLNKALDELRADGTYKQIYAKWFGDN